MSRVLTALQPTGVLHIGNYFGAIEPFLKLQDQGNENFLFAVDYHAITVPQDPETLRKNLLFATAVYLAAGVDPSKTTLFQQSHVQEHTELAWILNCIAGMGELERMTQYKDKAKGKGESVSVGLFAYPVLMAADILLYDTHIVPVGEDQKQHVELARDLAERFNNRFGFTFVIPKPQIRESGARIMGLDDPEKKMSKSAPSEKNYISLMDDEATVLKKIKSAVTDSEGTIVYREHRKGMANLMTIYSLMSGSSMSEIEKIFEGKGYGDFKVALAAEITAFLSPLQTKIKSYLEDEDALRQVLASGAEKAREIAAKKMTEVRKKIGVA
ncbi:tryptophan--tRNA ligase [Candidatus Uhrbacteria bacterium RIFCSPHIGHO2_02_FULL_47_44]|uniref:Tryptophan--tRNA ligase n=1 Tax=Candidatus Uhrbacteria bacterium RIFCSPLOWO2_02_FULL_48_18 TaxID=1802408 RepID=A0A1F7V8D6_9BACT|nr:MAG: tryptophan--tRNA ligase [Candidatus Uhrbacteria bacterium RIFCSPHIGHO2_02_FULL_47_44]OGL76095.1 MAG: tryptophan--tRNA ligase [Candidatus Uhrbacteria bacterium RIFCSPHIGHO2_12_FULL_47_12]OGL80375.1 MAG: tryptophan--tRNA ligase [Candidatus Uhrbacteria bacterium RIFCSPLOWO2_01_FULL_47_17]OGL86234.1 MAG: tryptophan--tRNA ligase [Candidatus Uhrbacteria bacterium RIFCSPLOWO2_02_FULL_48_18]OGL93252.1 MAG: tryptophan--tRNA ligase [Candidatus Uhrbacteria bacterium RIFCSPLOWO2_12_FULL_47_9]